jgi:hypothetical protein
MFRHGHIMYSGIGGDYIQLDNGGFRYFVFCLLGNALENRGVVVQRDGKSIMNFVCKEGSSDDGCRGHSRADVQHGHFTAPGSRWSSPFTRHGIMAQLRQQAPQAPSPLLRQSRTVPGARPGRRAARPASRNPRRSSRRRLNNLEGQMRRDRPGWL